MRTLVHLSDLHFGKIHYPLMEPLVAVVKGANPDLIVISGDFTQRARPVQFKEARQFIGQLPFPLLVVPGNHDVPLYNLIARFGWPLRNYRRYISDDLSPFFRDSEMAVAGMNTARSFTRMYGRISRQQIDAMEERFHGLGSEIVKVVVTHHPFELPAGYHDSSQLVGRSALAMKAFAKVGIDLILSGHLHLTHAGLTNARYKITGYSALVVQAGTATSTRGRGETNSFNVIRMQPGEIDVERILWNPELKEFRPATSAKFRRGAFGWEQSE